MEQFKFTVNIEASSNTEAKTKLGAALKIMKAACNQMSVDEFAKLCDKIEKKPSKIKLAKNFI